MKKSVLLFLVFAAAETAFADPSVAGITVKQRWPWSDKIDIDFTLSATTNCDIRFSFSHSGTATMRPVTKKLSDATLYGVAPGEGHFTMTPADLGIKGKSIANLVVTAEEVASVADRTFLVIDLLTGGYEYMAARPSDEWGWTNAVYKGQKMAFRRVPAGTYTVGHTEAEMRVARGSNPTAAEKSSMLQRQVILSSDYYVGIFPVTVAHMAYLYGRTDAEKINYNVWTKSYDAIRGMTNADESVSINWPITGIGEFGANTFLASLQARVGGKLAIDLPTETQWEVAMRAGTTTIFHNGGTSDSTQDELKSLWQEFAPNQAEEVGLRSPNQWDIYNPMGMAWYFCIDAFPRTTTAAWGEQNTWPGQSGRDPVGQTILPGNPLARVTRGGGYQSGGGIGSMPGVRRGCDTDYDQYAFRLAIHLADPRIRR